MIFRDFLKKENKGSSIVIVIVAMAAIGILSATIMWLSMQNYQMKVTDHKAKESFYSAETIFEQIIAGLQEDASKAASQSYDYVMQNYGNWDEDNRNNKFMNEYLNNLQEILNDGAAPGPSSTQFQLSHIQNYLVTDTASPYYVTLSSAKPAADPVRWLTLDYDEATDSGSTVGTIMRPLDEDYLVLEGFHLEYTNVNGYTSIIETDMVIYAPTLSFTQTATVPDVFDFALVANSGLATMKGSGTTSVNGSIYAGINSVKVTDPEGDAVEAGTSVFAKRPLQFNNADFVIAKGVFDLKDSAGTVSVGGSTATDVPQFWAGNIRLGGSDRLNVTANTYVADDLTMQGNGSVASIKNSYIGYGNETIAAELSSAIVVNGSNSTIDLSNLDTLVVAGNAYVSTSQAAKVKTSRQPIGLGDQTVLNAYKDYNKDIMMGESIAVKGNQIAYLVPDVCIGVQNVETVVGKNPLSATEYEKLLADMTTTFGLSEVSFDIPIPMLNNQPLSAYAGTVKKIFVPSNGETLVYYYIVLAEEKRDEFFRDYYGVRKDKIDDYFNIYAKGGIHFNNSFSRVVINGNYMTSVSAGGVQQVTLHEPTTGVVIDDIDKECGQYKNIAKALNSKLMTDYNSVTAAELAQDVFENLMKMSDLQSFIPDGITREFQTDAAMGGYKAIFTAEDNYAYNGDNKVRLIVARHNVTVNNDFNGIIIADGRVILKTGVSVTSAKINPSIMSDLLQVLSVEYSTVDARRPIDFFRNSTAYTLSGSPIISDPDKKEFEDVDITSLVQYRNWVKK